MYKITITGEVGDRLDLISHLQDLVQDLLPLHTREVPLDWDSEANVPGTLEMKAEGGVGYGD
jgi:hypothetical protein